MKKILIHLFNRVFRNCNFTVSALVTQTIDIWLNIITYRKDFITKSLSDFNVDKGNKETGNAPLLANF